MPEPRAFSGPTRWAPLIACGILVLAAMVAYHNSFSKPLIFDDQASISDNATIRSLWPLGPVLSPPAKAGVGGRPVLNLSFAINYAFGGTKVWGYHAVNLLIHILAGLTLFGVMRRTVANAEQRQARRSSRLPRRSTAETGAASEGGATRSTGQIEPTLIAFSVALLWLLHPLQTESVTYVSERAESLMGLFYLLTLYCFIRGADEAESTKYELRSTKRESTGEEHGARRRFVPRTSYFVLSVSFCFLGTMTKEVMVTAPVIVFLYDRTFVAGTFREALRRRLGYYLGLGCSWLLLAHLMGNVHERGVSFNQDVAWWTYAMTECRVVVRYLGLAFWPRAQVFDYGTDWVRNAGEVAPYAVALLGLLAGTGWALFVKTESGRGKAETKNLENASKWRLRFPLSAFPLPLFGFLGAFFFITLAPTSSVVAVAGEPMAEHRMYLPLAAVAALIVLGAHALAGSRSLILFLALAVGLGFLTARRNEAYASELSIWTDTVTKRPANERAQNSLGLAFFDLGRVPEAIACYETAISLRPDYAKARNNLGIALDRMGRAPEAIEQYEEAARLMPDSLEIQTNLGSDLNNAGRPAEALPHLREAARLDPGNAQAHNNLGIVLARMGRLPEAISQFEDALRINPDVIESHLNLGNALRQTGRIEDARAQFEEAGQLRAKQ